MSVEPPPSRLVTLRNAFFSGVLLLAPLAVTVWAFTAIIDFVGGRFRPIFFSYVPETWATYTILWNILSTILVVAFVTGLGFLSRYVLGKYFFRVGERFILSIPGVNAVYNTVKQIVDTFGTTNRNLFSKVVLVEFPRKGAWSIGFLTNRGQSEPQLRTGTEVMTVFVPTTPNPTSGFLVLIPSQEVVELQMSVGDGMKMVISGGSVIPPWPMATTVQRIDPVSFAK